MDGTSADNAATHGRNTKAEVRAILAETARPKHLLCELCNGSRTYAAELDTPEQPEAGTAQL
ncbi:hypothetical protein ACL02S_08170 [Nocardia sp. 004]|uniref:hypothetical protein n=1 Tax=Nocardia sp. 004 TaxID=3385978 RepID=UPI0039A11B46